MLHLQVMCGKTDISAQPDCNYIILVSSMIVHLLITGKMQQSLTSTNGVVFIDDPEINRTFAEFLLQVQGHLLSGSNKEGMSAPRAGVMLSSNSPEISRIAGRIIRFNYTSPKEGMNHQHDSWMLENSLIPHLKKNKAFS
ncbi:uncharacterized protein [Montipora capricornis]|uniref:uncharacterized protein n=1 Tax=Montipora capricornis TaxID=246305 RepID=UPI0035F1C54E